MQFARLARIIGGALVLPLACAAVPLLRAVRVRAQDAGVRSTPAASVPPGAARGGKRKVDLVEALLAKMTLEEKAGQLTQWGAQDTPTGPRVKAGSEDDIKAGKVGSFLGAYGVEATRRLQKIAVEESRLHVPLLFSFDVIHGFRTVFPVPLAEASSFDPELAERTARAAAVEATAHGLQWTFAPMVDIARDPRWGRVVEGAGEDTYLGAALAVGRVRGFRGDPASTSSLMACAKHFVGYGAAEAGRDYNTVDMSERTLWETYLPPFRAALEAGVETVMPAFNELAGVPMHAHRPLIRDVLRGRWGFQGIVVSDYTGIMELTKHGIAGNAAEASRAALEATVDVDMIADYYIAELPNLVRSGKVPKRLLDDAARRVLRAKEQAGLFADPYRHMDAQRERDNVLTPAARALAREAGQKSIVLLKNDRNLLPLKKDLGTLAVIGTLAEDALSTLGSWAGAGRAKDTVTVLDGIRRALPRETKVIYARGASVEGADTSGFDEAEQVAREADAVVVVLGESATFTGEASSRTSLGLLGVQDALFERLYSVGKPLIVLLMNGRPLAIPRIAARAGAIVETWYLGHEMGNAVADVLFGDVNPSGKLPITFPRGVGQVPIHYDHKNTGRPPRAEEHYTSKYADMPWTPLYPFGYGLSYTTFEYDKPRLSADKLAPKDTLTVSVTVKNTGARAGDEIVQLYLRDDIASFTRPVRALRGFKRVPLAAGESKELTFTLDHEDFALLDDKLERIVEAGTFTVFVGGHSDTDNQVSFEITKTEKLTGGVSAIPRELRLSPRP